MMLLVISSVTISKKPFPKTFPQRVVVPRKRFGNFRAFFGLLFEFLYRFFVFIHTFEMSSKKKIQKKKRNKHLEAKKKNCSVVSC